MAPTQSALYAEIAEDFHLSWSESELPERERTKHVHRLHPYLGKFVPQLVEALLERYVRPGGRVLDPFAGSGTTLVQSLESGYDAVGVDVAAFNCLLMRVKTASYNVFRLEKELRDADSRRGRSRRRARGYVGDWYAPRAAAELLHFQGILDEYEHADVLRVVLARAARSARLTTHFDLEFPREPQREPYWCHKHRRTCRPVEEAGKFLGRYLIDTVDRLKSFQRVRARGRAAEVLHGDARSVALEGAFDGIVTSPPTPASSTTTSRTATHTSCSGWTIVATASWGQLHAERAGPRSRSTARNLGKSCVVRGVPAPGAPVLIVVNDRRGLYPDILERSGLRLKIASNDTSTGAPGVVRASTSSPC